MLKNLFISNYVLIDKLNIEFLEGLNIITGETGAGKSVLLGALGLILGNKFDTALFFDKTKKCIVEALFQISLNNDKEIRDFFEENELDFENEILIRREINPEGKSRAFINDTPTNLNVLKILAEKLIDIHSQHQTLLIGNPSFQMELVDCFAKNEKLLTSYKENWQRYITTNKKLNALIEEEKKAQQEYDYWKFQYEELENAKILPDELSEKEKELNTLINSEEIKLQLNNSLQVLYNDENSVINLLSRVKKNLQSISRFNKEYEILCRRIDSVLSEIKDITFEIEKNENEIFFDNEKISQLTERIDLINRLLNKHRCKSEEELIFVKNDFENKLKNFSTLEDEIRKLAEEKESIEQRLHELALKLSDNRIKVRQDLIDELVRKLQMLGIPDAQVEIKFTKNEELTSVGYDRINIMFSANKGAELRDISKSASGGELSRIMLALKSIVYQKKNLCTLVFDEIDTGVSGAVAEKTGNILKELSQNIQIIAITHLPQIACKADKHFKVFKRKLEDKTISDIMQLDINGRINEIASMLSGDKVSNEAIKNAKVLLNLN